MAAREPLETTDFLPQVDAELNDTNRASLLAQIHAERPSNHDSKLHRLINTSYMPSYPPCLQSQHDTLNAGIDLSSTREANKEGIDLTRYEQDALEPPNRTFPTSDQDRPEFMQQWRDTLQRAYASSTYLSGRNTNLALLETYGKNAWLVSNWQLEAEIAALDAEVAEAKQQAEILADERRQLSEAGAAELVALEERWKKGIGGLVDVQVATEKLRREVLERKMEIAGR